MEKVDWARSEIKRRATGVSDLKARQKIFKQVWAEANKKFPK